MKKLFFIGLCLCYCYTQTFAQMEQALQKQIEKIIYFDAKVSFENTPGFIIGIIHGDSTYIYPYGHLEKGNSASPTSKTIFEMGGATKVFTACLVQLLVDEGKLDYESPINAYLTEEQSNPVYDQTTILDAITHTTGLPRMPIGFGAKEFEDNNPYAHYKKSDLFEFYVNYSLQAPKEKSYIYSNVAYALLQQVLENVSGQNYETLLTEKIAIPLSMRQTSVNIDEAFKPLLASGHTLIGKPTKAWSLQSFEGSIGLKSSTTDLLRFLEIQMSIKDSPLSQSFEKMHAQEFKTDIDNRTYIAKGWHIIKNKRYHDILAHSGSTSGHRMFMGFVKETKTGVVVLSNSENGTNGLGYLILKMLNNNWKKKKSL